MGVYRGLFYGDLLTNRGSVENWTGVRGAYLSDLLMNRWFGISSFMILFFLGSVGAKLMNLNKVSLLRRFLFSASVLDKKLSELAAEQLRLGERYLKQTEARSVALPSSPPDPGSFG